MYFGLIDIRQPAVSMTLAHAGFCWVGVRCSEVKFAACVVWLKRRGRGEGRPGLHSKLFEAGRVGKGASVMPAPNDEEVWTPAFVRQHFDITWEPCVVSEINLGAFLKFVSELDPTVGRALINTVFVIIHVPRGRPVLGQRISPIGAWLQGEIRYIPERVCEAGCHRCMGSRMLGGYTFGWASPAWTPRLAILTDGPEHTQIRLCRTSPWPDGCLDRLAGTAQITDVLLDADPEQDQRV